MKRDLDIIKNILLQTEEAPTFDIPINIKIEGKTEDEIEYHIQLLAEAELIHISDAKKTVGSRPTCLTGQGHDFLSTIRNPNVWNKTTKFIKDKGGEFTLDIVKSIGIKFLESHFDL